MLPIQNASRVACQRVVRISICLALIALTGCDALWKPAESAVQFVPTPQAINSEIASIKIGRLKPPFNRKVSMTLPGGEEIVGIRSAYKEYGKDRFVWRGSIKGDSGSSITLSVVDDRLVGDIATSEGRTFSIRHLEVGVVLIEELDPTKFPAEEAYGRGDSSRISDTSASLAVRLGQVVDPRMLRNSPAAIRELPPMADAPVPEPIQGMPLTDEVTYVDLLVLYTAASKVDQQGDSIAVDAKIQEAIDRTNQSFTNSGIHEEVRIARAQETGYQEKSDIGRDWLALLERDQELGSDPTLHEVDGLMNAYQADILVLLTKPAAVNESCGNSSQMQTPDPGMCSSAVAVVPITCSTTKYSFAHELGHVMGADHNTEGGRLTPSTASNRGYISPSNSWHTIMAKSVGGCLVKRCQRVNYWSDPDRQFPRDRSAPQVGPAMEDMGSRSTDAPANNAETLRQTRSIVAQFSDQCSALWAAGAGGN